MAGGESDSASNGTDSSDSGKSTSTSSSPATPNYLPDHDLEIKNQPLRIQTRPDRPLAGQIREPKERRFRTAAVTRSILSLKSLTKLFQVPQAKGVLVHIALGDDRIHKPPLDATGFYSKYLSVGVGVPVHPFFISILESYGIAPAQLNPVAWCHMLGVFLLWDNLGFGVPSLNVWHYLYNIHPIGDHPYFYYFTRWASGEGMMIEQLSNSSGGWRERFFFLDVATGGPGLLQEFAIAQSVPRPKVSAIEHDQIKAAYAVEDRSWVAISKDRRVCAMGKFNIQDNRERLKAIAREKKEKALAKEKIQGPNLKRKETETRQVKKPRTLNEDAGVESAGKKSTSELMVVGSPQNKGMEVIPQTGKDTKSSSDLIKLKPFLDDVVQAFARSAAGKPSSPQTDSQKFRLAFNKSAMALHAQHEMLCKFESLEGPLRERIDDLVRQLGKAEEAVESANMVIKKRDESLARLEASKVEADEVIGVLKSDLACAQKKNVVETEKLRDQIAGLREKIDQFIEENERLKRGEGVDLEVIIGSVEFAEIKDRMDDSVGEELIRRINAAHPEWDLSFLTEVGVDLKASVADRDDTAAGEKGGEVDPEKGG